MDIVIAVFIALLIAYVLIIFSLIRKHDYEQLTGRILLGYVFGSTLLSGLVFASELAILDDNSQKTLLQLVWWVECALIWVLLVYGYEFLSVRPKPRSWVWGGGIWLGIELIIIITPFMMIASNRIQGELTMHSELIFLSMAAGWLILSMQIINLTLDVFPSFRQPLHRNRIIYWVIALSMAIISDIVSTFGLLTVGMVLQLAGVLLLVYVAMYHDLVDLLYTGLRTLVVIIEIVLTMVVYTLVFLWIEFWLQQSSLENIFLFASVLAGIFVFVLNPVLRWVNGRIETLILKNRVDFAEVIRDYSKSISNVVDLGFLVVLAIKKIRSAIGVSRGDLYLVDLESEAGGESRYHLQGISDELSDDPADSRYLGMNHPIAKYFVQTRRPITQYDIDFLPPFRVLPAKERCWLGKQDYEVYVPVFSKTGWIGLFALGPKVHFDRYYDEDLTLLTTLADQTAIALENARLFDNLTKINRDLDKTKKNVEEANQQLREIDQIKSSFIGVITHELRTPLANLAFSMQVLEMYGRDHLHPDQVVQLDQIKRGITETRRMVDNLVTFTEFLNRKIELQMEPIEFKQLVSQTVQPILVEAEQKGIFTEMDIVGEFPFFQGDRQLIAIAIHQLVDNAKKFTPAGGKIWLTSWSASDTINFNVRDSGIGIAPERIKEIWDAFSQGSDPVRRSVEGLGLGLALVKLIISAHHGQVWAESRQGEGSSFGFRIPVNEFVSWD
jgi:signal transduction histidine kinase